MPNFNKSKGFKMSGYSYPGESPMKGKRKDADKAAAAEGQAEATAKMEEFGDMKMQSTDLLAKDSFKVDIDQSPVKKVGPVELPVNMGRGMTTNTGSTGSYSPPAGKKSLGGAVKAAASSKIGQSIGEALITTAISTGINAIGKKKEKPKRKAADQSGFASINFGRK